MKSLLCFYLLFFVAAAEAKVDWQYKSFPYLPKDIPQKRNEPEVLKVGKTPLRALMSRQSGTHVRWGVEQVYLSKDLKKKVFVKYQVALSSASPVGGWMRLKKGQVLHLRKGKTIVAYMAQGFNNRELYELQMQLQDKQKVSAWNPFINCANAEVVTSPAGDVYYDDTQNTASAAPPAASSSWLSRAGSISLCVGSETLEGAKESARQLWENASLEGVVSGAQAAASAAWQAVPSRDEIRSGWRSTKEFFSSTWNDPEQAWSDVVDGFDRSVDAIARIAEQIAKSVEGFYDLSQEIQNRIICDGVSYFAATGALSVAMSMTGAGAAVAVARLASTALLYANRIKPLMHIIRVLNVSDLESSEKMEQVEALLKGNMSQQEQQAIIDSNAEYLPAGAAAASSSVASRLTGIRAMGEGEKAAMLRASSSLDNAGRARAAQTALGRPLTAGQTDALSRAHGVAPERGFGSYTQADLLEKTRILREAGFSNEEAELLLRQGLAGQYVSGSVTFQGQMGQSSLSSTSQSAFATANPNYTLMKLTSPTEFTQARTFFNNRAQDALRNHRTSYARSDFLSAGNHEGYIETFITPRSDGGYRMVDTAEARAAIAQLQREINSVSISDAGRVNIPTDNLSNSQFIQGEALYSQEYVRHHHGVRERAIRELQEWLSTAESQ